MTEVTERVSSPTNSASADGSSCLRTQADPTTTPSPSRDLRGLLGVETPKPTASGCVSPMPQGPRSCAEELGDLVSYVLALARDTGRRHAVDEPARGRSHGGEPVLGRGRGDEEHRVDTRARARRPIHSARRGCRGQVGQIAPPTPAAAIERAVSRSPCCRTGFE